MSSAASAWSEHKAPNGRPYYHNSVTRESTWERPRELGPAPPPLPASYPGDFDYGGGGYGYGGGPSPTHGGAPYGAPYGGPAAGPGYHGYVPGGYGSGGGHQIGPGAPIQKGRSATGPPGSNLFIFHIPNDVTNRDLYSMFSPYGSVVSARIMVERETGRSRGFGFVSYDSPSGAEAAIRAMDGFQLGRKRLKVTLKKERADGSGGYFDDYDGAPGSIDGSVSPTGASGTAGPSMSTGSVVSPLYGGYSPPLSGAAGGPGSFAPGPAQTGGYGGRPSGPATSAPLGSGSLPGSYPRSGSPHNNVPTSGPMLPEGTRM